MLAIQSCIAKYHCLYAQGAVASQTPGVFLTHQVQIVDFSKDALTQLLSCDDEEFFHELNRNILKLAFCFIHELIGLTKIFQTSFSHKATTSSRKVSIPFASKILLHVRCEAFDLLWITRMSCARIRPSPDLKSSSGQNLVHYLVLDGI